MKTLRALPMVLVLAAICAAQEAAPVDLQRKADQASGTDCAQLSMQAARKSLEDADRLFRGDGARAAHGAIDVSLHYAGRSVDCALESRKHVKSAEIEMRELIRRMNDVRQTLDSAEQPQLSLALAELEKQRDRLLRALFGPAAGRSAENTP
jgi:hypothetical protein